MRLEHVFLLVSASLLAPSTHAATTYNLPLLQETLEIIGGDIFTGITKMLNGGGAFKSLAEGIGYGKRHVYDKSSEQTGGIEDDDLDEEQEAGDDNLLDEDKPTVETPGEETSGAPNAGSSGDPKDPGEEDDPEDHEGEPGVDNLLKEEKSTTATAGMETTQSPNTGRTEDSKSTAQEEDHGVKNNNDSEDGSTPETTGGDEKQPSSNSDSEGSKESDSEDNEESPEDVEENDPEEKKTSESSEEDIKRATNSVSSNDSESSDDDNDNKDEASPGNSDDKKLRQAKVTDYKTNRAKGTISQLGNAEEIKKANDKDQRASSDLVDMSLQDSSKLDDGDIPASTSGHSNNASVVKRAEVSTKEKGIDKSEDQENQIEPDNSSVGKDKVAEQNTDSSNTEMTKDKTDQNIKFIKSFIRTTSRHNKNAIKGRRPGQKSRKGRKEGGAGHGYLNDSHMDEEEPSSKDDADDDDAQALASAFVNIAAQKLMNHFEGLQL